LLILTFIKALNKIYAENQLVWMWSWAQS